MLNMVELAEWLANKHIWSLNTFGPGERHQGVIDHIKKELVEIEAKPHDLSEWVDVLLLAFDGALRQGYTAEQVVSELLAKQERNEKRKWPDWKTATPGKAIEHIREDQINEFSDG